MVRVFDINLLSVEIVQVGEVVAVWIAPSSSNIHWVIYLSAFNILSSFGCHVYFSNATPR
jgi:hypothetical protein